MKRLTKQDVKANQLNVAEAIEILVSIQQARYDKLNYGDGLSIQELSELKAINELFKN